jgi:hypothetical protein
VQLSRTGYTNRGYSHQGWLTEDHSYVLLDDELDERQGLVSNTRTLLWDVSDLDAPVQFAEYQNPLTTSIDHNQYVVGNHVYQANYRSGLRILDISDIAIGNLSEVGYFDIYPANDSAEFNGAWSVYPFFASGNVVVSGIEQGLYILRPNLGVSNDAPVVNLIEPADGANISGTVPVRIDATDTEDAAGSLTVEWNVDGGAWQPAAWDGAEYSASWDTTLGSGGAHVVNARAIDSALSEGSDSNGVTVTNGAQEFTVDTVIVSIDTGKGNRNRGEALVTVTDGDGNLLDVVAISGTFSGGWSGVRNGITDGFGQLLLQTPRVKNLSFVQFCVDNASSAGWDWNIAGSTICGDSNGGGSAFGSVAGSVTDIITSGGITNAAVSTDTGQSTNTDAFGDYTINNVPVGNRTVSVTASGYEGQNTTAGVTDGNTTIVDFSLSEPVTGGSGAIKGTVYSSGGGKISGVTVQVVGGTSSMTNKGGKYTIQNVPEGLQTVIASKPGFMSQQKDVSAVANATVTLDFTLVPQ